MKHQTRTVVGFPDAAGFAVGSIEGKLALEFFEDQASGDATVGAQMQGCAKRGIGLLRWIVGMICFRRDHTAHRLLLLLVVY